jgi:hypothetical protein
MIQEGRVSIEGHGSVRVAYLESVPHKNMPRPPLAYLHSVRSSAGKSQSSSLTIARQGYLNSLKSYQDAYRRWAQDKAFDAVMRVPSARCDAVPYLHAILLSNPLAIDLSDAFEKRADWKSGNDHDLNRARAAISASLSSQAYAKSIAIIDDTLNMGTTMSIVLELLKKHDLPASATIWLAIPLVLRTIVE